MTTGKIAAIALGLAVMLILYLGLRGGSGPISDPGRDAHIDSSAAVQRADSTALASADTALARAARDSSVQRLSDSASSLGRRLDSLDRVAARLRRANMARRDSLNAFRLEPDAGTPDTTFLDTATVIIGADSAASCEARYQGRLEQLSLLGAALDRCRARGDTVRSTLVGVRDQLALSTTYLAASDSLLRWERDRPRACRVNLLVTSVGCGTALGGTAVIAFLGGLFVGH